MREPEVTFVIPTYRLRDVAETVDAFDEHFWRNGQDDECAEILSAVALRRWWPRRSVKPVA